MVPLANTSNDSIVEEHRGQRSRTSQGINTKCVRLKMFHKLGAVKYIKINAIMIKADMDFDVKVWQIARMHLRAIRLDK